MSTILDYATDRRADIDAAVTDSQQRLAQAQSKSAAESSKVAKAVGELADLEKAIANIRQELSAIPTPADGEILLVRLEQKIIQSRAKEAEILALHISLSEAQSSASLAQADLANASAELTKATAALRQADSTQKQRAELITALTGPLATIKTNSTAALDTSDPEGVAAKAKERIEDDIPEPLRARARARRAAQASRLEQTSTARQAAEDAANEERDLHGGDAGQAISSLETLSSVEATVRDFVCNATSRFDRAQAKLAQVADPTRASLTDEQKASISAEEPLKTEREDAIAEEEAVGDARNILDGKQADLDAAILEAKAAPTDSGKQSAVNDANDAVDIAKTALEEAQALYLSANQAVVDAWEAAVPDTTWRMFEDYEAAVETLQTMPNPVSLNGELVAAETLYVTAQLVADRSAQVLADLMAEKAQRAAREATARQTGDASLFSALRGDNE